MEPIWQFFQQLTSWSDQAGASSWLLGIALILGIVIALRILLQIADAIVQIGCTIAGIAIILFVLFTFIL